MVTPMSGNSNFLKSPRNDPQIHSAKSSPSKKHCSTMQNKQALRGIFMKSTTFSSSPESNASSFSAGATNHFFLFAWQSLKISFQSSHFQKISYEIHAPLSHRSEAILSFQYIVIRQINFKWKNILIKRRYFYLVDHNFRFFYSALKNGTNPIPCLRK